MNETTSFAGLGLSEPLVRALEAEQFRTPTPIQAQAIPSLLSGRDVLGIAQTGTGKTFAFGLPVIDRLLADRVRPVPKGARALVLAPTRELASQIEASLSKIAKPLGLRLAVIFGGVGFGPQINAMSRGVDILVATPGRLMDLIQRGAVRLDNVHFLVLDEADRMLDMGFVHDVLKIVDKLPSERQSLLFSATMPSTLSRILTRLLKDPVRVEVTPEVVAVDRIEQHLYQIEAAQKRHLLVRLLQNQDLRRVVVFTRTKRGADRVAEALDGAGHAAAALHGNKSQGARQKALARFKTGDVRVLVATDIAARGIDVADVTHVVNFELPDEPESYVHRIGRTARAGRAGVALSFCDRGERDRLKAIERLIRRPLAAADPASVPAIVAAPAGAGPVSAPVAPAPRINQAPAQPRPAGARPRRPRRGPRSHAA
ncbi:DEAD/DEAH box helicase [Segnochrobactraceae bacterium EtOH-i3]